MRLGPLGLGLVLRLQRRRNNWAGNWRLKYTLGLGLYCHFNTYQYELFVFNTYQYGMFVL